jgi:hypothetical protein
MRNCNTSRMIVQTPQRSAPDEVARLEALERLYRRRETVDQLILHFEQYEELLQPRRATVIPIRPPA